MVSDTEAVQLLSAGSPDHGRVGLTHTHTHTHSRAIFPARTLSLLTRAHSLLARACSLFYFRAKNRTKKVQALRLTEKNKSPSISHD